MSTAEEPSRSTLYWAYAAIAMTAFCWSANWIAGRALHDELSPVAISFWRWVIAGALFLPFGAPGLWRERHILLAEWRQHCVFGFIGVFLFNTLVYWGLHTTGAINGAVLNSSQPIYVIILSWLFFAQRTSWREIAGVAISIPGVAMIVSRGDLPALLQLQFTFGDLLILIAMGAWSVYTILLKAWPSKLSGWGFLSATIVFGLPMVLPFYLVDLWLYGAGTLTWKVAAGTAYLGTLGSIIAYLCFNYGVTRAGPARATLILHLIPVFTALQAIAFLGESLELFHFIGVALILGGIYVATGKAAAPAGDAAVKTDAS